MYLAKTTIKNFRGIKELEISFGEKINLIIGENGANKTALIDALRVFYSLGLQRKDIQIHDDDFFYDKENKTQSTKIEFYFEFKNLTDLEKGQLYEYLVLGDDEKNDYATCTLRFEKRVNNYPKFSYFTGISEEQKADHETFEVFNHYFLGALRDGTSDLVTQKNNLVGSVVKRIIEREKTEDDIKKIFEATNKGLLEREEVKRTKTNINQNIKNIFVTGESNEISLLVTPSKLDSIINIIKPFLPYDATTSLNEGFNLWQNSLGFNNIIYVATVLGDIKERIANEPHKQYALLIEEPEAHLHPQLQLNLYNFLKVSAQEANCQLFVTTHSPSLTSKAEIDNIIVLDKNKAFNISNCFTNREFEGIIEDTHKKVHVNAEQIRNRKRQLQRYLDVTKSQLFFSKKLIFVEGISEELLLNEFSSYNNTSIQDYRIEVVNVDGISFYPFLYLFNSSKESINLQAKISIITDDDRYLKSSLRDYSFKNLLENNYSKLDLLHKKIYNGSPSNRISNILSTIQYNRQNIKVFTALKTFEYEIALSNALDNIADVNTNLLWEYICRVDKVKYNQILNYLSSLGTSTFSQVQKEKMALLIWKALPGKAEFAQSFSEEMEKNKILANPKSFTVPKYILNALTNCIV